MRWNEWSRSSECAVIDRRKGERPTSLGCVLRFASNRTQPKRIKITALWNGHGEPPSFATVNHINADLRTARESASQGLIPTGINQNPWAHFRRPIDMIFQG